MVTNVPYVQGPGISTEILRNGRKPQVRKPRSYDIWLPWIPDQSTYCVSMLMMLSRAQTSELSSVHNFPFLSQEYSILVLK